jgi:hypothetical protein
VKKSGNGERRLLIDWQTGQAEVERMMGHPEDGADLGHSSGTARYSNTMSAPASSVKRFTSSLRL